MMKMFLAGVTAAVIAAPMFSVPITAAEAVIFEEDMTYTEYSFDRRDYLGNILDINVLNPDGTFISVTGDESLDTTFKLFDASGRCQIKYTTDIWSDNYIHHDSGIGYFTKNLKFTYGELLTLFPDGHDIMSGDIYSSPDSEITIDSGETWDITYTHDYNDYTPEVTLDPGYAGIHVSPLYAESTYDSFLSIHDPYEDPFSENPLETIYYRDILEQNDGILIKYISNVSQFELKMHAICHSHLDFYPDPNEDKTQEFVLCRANVADIIEFDPEEYTGRFLDDGTVSWIAADSEGVLHTVESRFGEQTDKVVGELIIASGNMYNLVVPDENGYVEFYVDKNSREYYYEGYFLYEYSDDAAFGYYTYSDMIHFKNHNSVTDDMAHSTRIIISNPVIETTGIDYKNVPAGEYILKFEDVPDGCAMPDPIPITITDTDEVHTVTVQFQTAEDPPAVTPEPAEPDYLLYNENVLNVRLKNQDGKYVSNGKLRFSDGENYIENTSGGTGFTASEDCPYTWHESLKWTDKSYTFEQIEKMSGLDDVFAFSWLYPNLATGYDSFGKRFKNSERYNNSSAPIEFDYGETRDITIYTKDDSEPTLITLSPLTTGIYVDEKWRNDLFTSYLIKDDIDTGEVVYFAPDGDDSVYGNVTYQSIDSGIYLGVCPKGTVPDTDTYYPHTSVYPYEHGLTTEYILKKVHISKLYDFVLSPEEESCFMNDGTFVCDDYLFNPRENDADAYMSIMIVSGGMISNVIPDEEGFVEFYLEKGDREYDMYISAISTASNAELSFKSHSKGICADSLTFSYQSAKLPDIGAVYTRLPAGEYTLTISDLPEEYRVPEDITVTVDSKAGVQLLEITLENKCTTGDIDQDDDIDLDDATLAISHYAAIGSDLELPLNAAQQVLADTNMDGYINLVDVSNIVSYYAYIGADGTGTLEDFLSKR